jgi:hypothetical protein
MVSNHGRAMYKARRNYKRKILVRKLETQEHVGDLGVVERIILKNILEN